MIRQLVALWIGASLVSTAATGQIRMFFDPAGVDEQQDRGTQDPLSYTNPTVIDAGRLYIYAEYHGVNYLWMSTSFQVLVVGDAQITAAVHYNHRTEIGPRWRSASATIAGDARSARFDNIWIGNPREAPGGNWNWDAAYAQAQTGDRAHSADTADPRHYRREWDSFGGGFGTTLLGYIDVSGTDAEIFFGHSSGFARVGGSGDDLVYFGFGDGPNDNPLRDAVVASCDPCDMNCDGAVNASDIEPFLRLLFEGETPCNDCTGDTNGDGRIDALDIEGFIACLFG